MPQEKGYDFHRFYPSVAGSALISGGLSELSCPGIGLRIPEQSDHHSWMSPIMIGLNGCTSPNVQVKIGQ
jgi:hypothetical protein